MAGVINEHYQSRAFTVSGSSVRELIYNIVGTDDEDEVLSLLTGEAPSIYKGLNLDSVKAEVVGPQTWKGTASYVRLVSGNQYTFSTGGGTRKVTQSIATINAYAPPGFVAPDFQGAIGVSGDKVEGVDLPAPKFEFSETHFLDDLIVTDSYKFMLARFSGLTMNDDDFKGFAAGECALIDVSGGKRDDQQWQLTFKFSGQPNATGLTIGDITGIDKLGWDYLWVRYASFEDASGRSLVQRPAAVYVERVLIPADYSLLMIGV